VILDRILVTGAAGFIGSHLCERLVADGRHVIGLDGFAFNYDPRLKRLNVRRLADSDRFELIEADICDPLRMQELLAEARPDAVIHLAALAGVRASIEHPRRYTEVNVNGTVNLLDAAARQGVRKFIFGSSSSVYGNNRKVPFAETDEVNQQISPYAVTKRAAELHCHTYWAMHGMPIACLRFFTVYGPRQRPDLAIGKFMRRIAAGETLPMFGDGSTSRDYTFVQDIVDGILLALAYDFDFEIFNLGSKRPISLSELIRLIEQVVERQASIERLPMQAGDVQRTYADLTKSQQMLGYSPKVTLEDGLRQQWQWMCDEGLLDLDVEKVALASNPNG